MNRKFSSSTLAAVVAGATLLSLNLHAGDLKPVVAKPGKLVVEDSFDRAQLGKGFAAVKGDWKIDGGSLTGAEKASDKHAAVLNYARPNTDSIVALRFQFDGASTFHLSFNHAKGHLFRVVVNPDGLVLQKDKDKKDPKSKTVSMAKAEGKFESGHWHSMLVEVHGDQVIARTDNGLKVAGSHSDFLTQKPNYRFIVRGKSIKLDDLKIWETAH